MPKLNDPPAAQYRHALEVDELVHPRLAHVMFSSGMVCTAAERDWATKFQPFTTGLETVNRRLVTVAVDANRLPLVL